jgi:Zn-dependent protease with chaperone function
LPRYDAGMMASVDLSFLRYVAASKGAGEARAREAAAYAYGGDLRVRTTMDKVRPVTLAVESAVRFWNTVGRSRLLGSAVQVSSRQFRALHSKIVRCAEVLQIPVPAAYVSPELAALGAHTFGSSEDATLVLSGALIDHLSDEELLFVIGHECGHIQNNHVVYLTALYYLTQTANVILRFGAQPAVLALRAWSRRAEITCDRAGLLCARELGTATNALIKLAIGSHKLTGDINVEEYLRQFEEARDNLRRLGEAFSTHPYLPTRVKALGLFAQTAYFRGVTCGGGEGPGLTREECDTQVADLLAVFK